jgi:trimeric autotransporter adhesin
MRRIGLIFASIAAAITLLAVGGVALAAPSSVPDAGTAQTDGRVLAILRLGNRVYLGGDFTHVNGVARNRLAAIDATTGKLTNWNPNANGSVRTLAASPDSTRIYAGGTFTSVGGTYRGRLAALDAATGGLDPTWKPGTANSTVRSIAVSGNRVYIGGDFTTLKGQSRERLALVVGATGALDPSWRPTANARVRALALSPTGSRLYVGGGFTAVSGRSRPYLVGLDAANTGSIVWQPLTNPNGGIFDVAARGSSVYSAEGGSGGAVAAYDTSTGITSWILHARSDGDVQALAYLDGKVYLGGHFTGFGVQERRYFAAVDATTGVLDSWNPRGGGAGFGVWALEADPLRTRIYAGGDFTSVSGVTHKHFAQFSE